MKEIKETRFTAERFKLKGFGLSAQIITDEETGVQYLFVDYGYSGGLTVMVDENGKPLTKKRENV